LQVLGGNKRRLSEAEGRVAERRLKPKRTGYPERASFRGGFGLLRLLGGQKP